MRSWLKKFFHSLLIVPPQEIKDATKTLRLVLAWILSFFALIQTFAVLQFLVDLDYSETNPVRLSRFIFARFCILMFLLFMIYWVWQKPRRILFCLLMALSFLTLWNNTDYISVFSASLVLALSTLLYVSLFKNPEDNSTH